MANSREKKAEGMQSKHKKRKLKESGTEETLRPCKKRPLDASEGGTEALKTDVDLNGEVEEGQNHPWRTDVNFNGKVEEGQNHPWSNLQLILSLQSKELGIQQKLVLAFNFVKTRAGRCHDDGRDYETVNLSRLIVFLNDWIQQLLISSGKKTKLGEKYDSGAVLECLKPKCWEIFKFCLEKSSLLHIPLNFSRNILHPISLVARHALNESLLNSEGFELYSILSDCISLLFSSHEGMSNENLELWIPTIEAVVELVNKVLIEKPESRKAGVLVQFSCLVLEQFGKFLRAHPMRKGGFAEFIDKLLEPLLELLGFMQLHVDESNRRWPSNLLKLVEEVLSHGLFHPTHVDGFLTLRTTDKYLSHQDGKAKASTIAVKSYHRHLFDKLERIVDQKKFMALNGIGRLFHLLADKVKKHTVKVVPPEGIKAPRSAKQPEDDARADKSQVLVNLNAETRKSLFDFFVQITEPLLLKLNWYLEDGMEAGHLEDIHCELNCLRTILSSFTCEKVYIKTEDISGGACVGFLKKVYDMLISLSIRLDLNWLSKNDALVRLQMENLSAVAEALIVALGCLLEIEYEVVGNDLVILWSLMISFLALGISLSESTDRGLLFRKIVNLGCQLVNLYSELRQVNSITFALCQSLRLLRVSGNSDKTSHELLYGSSISSYGGYVKSVGTLLCSQEFKQVLRNAISSIPEGQATGCIRRLAEDVSESLMWLKMEHSKIDGEGSGELDSRGQWMLYVNLQCEVLGRGLAEIYSLVLDSLTVTGSNSTLVGSSVKDLMAVIHPGLGISVGLPSQCTTEFLSSLTGCHPQVKADTNHEMSTHWVLVFFFSLYVSCRSLSRQIISLMPPDSARKMSASLSDLLTAYPGKDLVERTDWTDEGYFSSISISPASVLDVIQSVSNVYLKSDVVDCSCLIYQLHVMALQRLIDLNRMIKSAEYMRQGAGYMLQSEVLDDGGSSVHHKQCRKWDRCTSKLKKEAAGLAEFILGYLTLMADGPSFSTCTGLGFTLDSPHESDKRDFSISSLNRRSFHTAIWWIICRNIDVWCSHAKKKKLKMFLSLLIDSSLSSTETSPAGVSSCKISSQPLAVTVQQISNDLLQDSALYEHKFVRRHLASALCKMLEKSAVALFFDDASPDIDFSLSPDWAELLVALEESLENSRWKQFGVHAMKPMFHSFESSLDDPNGGVFHVTSRNFAICHNLLRFLCWMPKGYLNSRSFRLYVTYVLNIERLAVSRILNYEGNSKTCNYHELFNLFFCCRKSLKFLFAASCNENAEAGVLHEGSFPFLWLLKSAYLVLGLQDAQATDDYNQHADTAFSLMDHTSYIFLVSSKYYFTHSDNAFLDAKVPSAKTETNEADANSIEAASYSDSCKDGEAWDSMFIIAHCIKKESQALLGFLEDALDDKLTNLGSQHLYSSKLSYLFSCLSGYFWGLASALSQIDVKDGANKITLLKSKRDFVSKLNTLIEIYSEAVRFQLCILLDCSGKLLDYCGNLSGVEEISQKNCTSDTNVCGQGRPLKGVVKACLESPAFYFDSSIANVNSHGSKMEVGSSIANTSAEAHSFDLHILNRPLLRRIMDGDECEAAFMLRHLLISYSAILRLNLRIGVDCLSPSVVHIFMAIAQFLILELANSPKLPEPFVSVALDGCLKYLEELGSHFPSTDPSLSRNVYTRLIELHLAAIGKCISLQGKEYTLISHEIESNTKFLRSYRGSNESFYLHSSFCLDELKARLRMSLAVFIRKSSELHLLSGIQAIERALVGVQVGCTANYDINTGKAGGGMVSPYVAAGIDCLDLLLENVTGRRCLNVVRRHIQSLLAGLFNIILHLQSPLIFSKSSIKNSGNDDPDPGSVILMCIQVLTRISGKHALFQMDPWHVAQSIRIPGVLFEEFSQFRLCKAPAASGSVSFTQNVDCNPEASVDNQFSVDIFAACCRLLYTILKHHKSESEKCISQLQDSASVLLNTLETVDTNSVSRKNCFSWNVEEGIKCACSLRRIYEEMRQQKDVFGPHCFKLLANYVWVYSGFGPLKSGIRREINEALRPGIYALIDACSPNDLQYLHTAFGEGPCRSTLATLQHDYTLNFQYEGKV